MKMAPTPRSAAVQPCLPGTPGSRVRAYREMAARAASIRFTAGCAVRAGAFARAGAAGAWGRENWTAGIGCRAAAACTAEAWSVWAPAIPAAEPPATAQSTATDLKSRFIQFVRDIIVRK